MSDVPFTLRDARESDLAYLNAYAAAEGMDDLPSAENVRVAVNEDDVPVGFLRLQQGSNGAAHVNPVVSCATWRGWGVGRALMEEALASRGELRLVRAPLRCRSTVPWALGSCRGMLSPRKSLSIATAASCVGSAARFPWERRCDELEHCL